MDKQFIAKMLKKYSNHLEGVVKNINTLLFDYDKQLESLSKLDQKKYGWRTKELEEKKSEALLKLSFVEPNINMIAEQLLLLEE